MSAALLEALKLAANRLEVLALDHNYGTTRRNIVDDWAKEARAAIAQAEAAQTPGERARAHADRICAQAEAAQPVAWAHPDGRVVTAATMASASRDGGAMLSSLAGYTVPLYAAPQPAEAAQPVGRWQWVPKEPTQEMHDAARAAMANGSVPMPTVYRAMLAAAAPQTPAPGAEGGDGA